MRTTVVAATATFAPTSYARARLLRALHGSGLLRSEQGGPAPLAPADSPSEQGRAGRGRTRPASRAAARRGDPQ